MSKFAFSFSKKIEKPSIRPTSTQFSCKDEEITKEKIEFIKSICNNQIESEEKPVEKKEIVIPLSLNERAKRELLNEAYGPTPILMQERNLKIELNKSQINDLKTQIDEADYDVISPDDFGMAMLRGMAKSKDDLVEGKIYEPKQSTGGVGLGFETHLKRERIKNKKMKNKRYLPGQDDDDEIFEKKDPDEMVDSDVRIGSLVCIEYGKQKGHYGRVLSINEDVTRCDIELSLSKEIVSLLISLIRLVSKKEYNKESKVLNRTKYDQYSSRHVNKDDQTIRSGHRNEGRREDNIKVEREDQRINRSENQKERREVRREDQREDWRVNRKEDNMEFRRDDRRINRSEKQREDQKEDGNHRGGYKYERRDEYRSRDRQRR